MDTNEIITTLLVLINEILAAGIVIIAASLLLYNLTRNLENRVARASGAVLTSVTLTYMMDVFLSLNPAPEIMEAAVRLQWIGIAFIPAALFHLSDVLLATTGLPSRGRRRAVVRLLYALSTIFLIAAALTDSIAKPIFIADEIRLQGQPYFVIYLAYFLTACTVTFINVQRARKRCLTDRSRRRMAYLQIAILTPALGIFPYTALLPASEGLNLTIQVLVNVANIVVVIMLIFLSYPLSFFGSDIPDRVVKVELLRFLLRGPGTGLVALAVIITTGRATEILGLRGDDFMPFAVVAAVLFWQWSIHLALPYLEKWLVYGDEDDVQISKLQDLSERVLTRRDLQQLVEATLETMCDYLRTEKAFVARFNNGDINLTQQVGELAFSEDDLQNEIEFLRELATSAERVAGRSAFQSWEGYQLVPLYSKRTSNNTATGIIGLLGIFLSQNPTDIIDDDEDTTLLYTLVQRAEQSLDDMLLQDEIFASLEGLLPQFHMTRSRADEVEYKMGHQMLRPLNLPEGEETYELVRAALRHYWGGAGITRSRLLELQIVQAELEKTDTPIQAMRNIIHEALERLRPDGERSLTGPEWTLYNIIDLRFIEGRKVRDVARRMSISEPDLYRKQRLAIESIADSILTMERESLNP
ncbi:MAG: histidine kinase N-terminal 7TM domain-containing protein [Anaerolineae bacterium]|nr:histidine kinase N-terminal 7TM domain-containing protein [Anaerolineae bacterium]